MRVRHRTTEALGLIALSLRIGEIDADTARELTASLLDCKAINLRIDQLRLERGLHPDIQSLLDDSAESIALHQNRFAFVQ